MEAEVKVLFQWQDIVLSGKQNHFMLKKSTYITYHSSTDVEPSLAGNEWATGTGTAPQPNELESGELLESLELWLHSQLLVFICQECQVGLTGNTVVGHSRKQHRCQVQQADQAALQSSAPSRGCMRRQRMCLSPRIVGPWCKTLPHPQQGHLALQILPVDIASGTCKQC